MIDEPSEESEAEEDWLDSVCALCDNGGKLLCCDGACMRSFHATEEDGRDSNCDSLGFTRKEVNLIQSFYCKNCKYNQHQCFACGKLGSSDKVKGAEVTKCSSATCGRFYHPRCVAKLLPMVVKFKHVGEELEKNIADGHPFICPVHYCCVCKELENKMEPELQLAVCRRCPKSYHRKCLPRQISFDDEDNLPRAWEGLLSNNRILIYCLNHEIDDELGTPKRDHLKFPNVKGTYPEINAADERTKPADKGRVILKKNNVGKDKGPNLIGRLSSGELSKKKKPKSNEMNKGYERIKPVNQVDNETPLVEPIRKLSCSLPLSDADSEKSLLALFKEARSSVTLESVKRKLAFTHTHAFRNVLEETITKGKLEGSVDAAQTALRKLESECSIQDVEAVCDPDVLKQIFMCKIIDKLHWYVQNGDTIVDFCCGANDFSILMKKKLEETGKKCSYRNYDLLPTKNGFSFEMRDWMTVQPTELPTGSQLIMCLDSPFGVKADLANKFIDKALEFKPKLLILIVPPETERLEKKLPRYDLVWEDKNFLLGMSSYVLGSDDVNDGQQDQRNGRPPLFSLWSHPDWTTRHKFIAREHGHMTSQVLDIENFNTEMLPADHTIDCNKGNNLMLNHDLLKSTNDQEVQASINEGQKRSSHHGNVNQERQQGQKCRMSKSHKTSRKRKHIRENDTRGQGVGSPAKRQAVNEMTEGVPDHSQPIHIDERFPVEGFQPKSDMASPQVEVGDDSYQLVMSKSHKTSRKRKHIRENDTRGQGVGSPAKRQAVNEMTEGVPDHSQPIPIDERSPVEGFQPKSDMASPQVEVGDDNYQLVPVSDVVKTNSGITNNRSGTFERIVPQPGHRCVLKGFASGPHVEYSRRHSAGWLEE